MISEILGLTDSYPLVSIGIPTFNSYGKIVKALISLWQQKYPNIEVVVSDNCSTDNTEEICKQFSKNFLPISYYRQEKNLGMFPNFQFVLEKARGKFFMWMSDDDQLEPDIISKYVHFLNSHKDYALVSGQICYWSGNTQVFIERDFTIEDKSPALRAIRYYSRVVHGAAFFGLMTKEVAEKIPLRNSIGNDWHYVANAAYLGKIKMLDCIGYNKGLGGISRDFKNYSKEIQATRFSSTFPRLKIAMDAFAEILYRSLVFRTMPLYTRFATASVSSFNIFFKYYFLEYPFVLGGKVKRLFNRVEELEDVTVQSEVKNHVGK